MPGGSENVSAAVHPGTSVVATTPVGYYPDALAFDNSTDQIFVANSYSNNVSVISAANDSLDASVNVGTYPIALAYDSSAQQLFVANDPTYIPGSVSVISTRNESVVSTIGIGDNPWAIAYDNLSNQVFAANVISNNVTVISAANDTVVANIPVGSWPQAFAEDPTTDQIFVANFYSNNVSVISAANDSLVATVNVGSDPGTLAYDPSSGQVLALNYWSKNVTVIAANDTVVATVPVGSNPEAIAVDSTSGQAFVANAGSKNVTVISLLNDTVVATVSAGSSPWAVTVDQLAGEVFVANLNSHNVSVISLTNDSIIGSVNVSRYPDALCFDPLTHQVFVEANGTTTSGDVVAISVVNQAATVNVTFTVDASLDLTTPAGFGSIDSGQVLTVQGSGFGASANISSLSMGNSSVACIDATLGQCVSGTVKASTLGVFKATVSVPVVPSDRALSVTAVDSVGNSATANLTVDTSPTIGAITASAASMDLGQQLNLTVGVATGGSGNFTYRWTGLPPGCQGVNSTVSCYPSTNGTYSVNVTATDSNLGSSGATKPLGISVYRDPTVQAPVASLDSGKVDAGQNVTFTANASFGSGSYVTYAWMGLPSAGCTGVTTVAVTCSGPNLPAGTYMISVNVTDSNGVTANSTTLRYSVDPDPAVQLPMARPVSGNVDAGQKVTFTANASFGSGSYTTYAWTGLPSTGCTGVATATVICSGSSLPAGTYTISVNVTDSNGVTASSLGLPFSVDPDPTVEEPMARPNSGSVDAGQNFTFTVRADLGSGRYTSYSWSGVPSGCLATDTPVVSCPAGTTEGGSYSITVEVTDSNGMRSDPSPVLSMMIDQDPQAAAPEASRGSADVGQTVVFTERATSGSGNYSFQWSGLPSGCPTASTNLSVQCQMTASGTMHIYAIVTDGNGYTVLSPTLSFTVYSAPSVTASATRTEFDVGQSATFTAGVQGGIGPYSYTWRTTVPTGCVGSSATLTCAVATYGIYSANVTVTDANGASAISATQILSVAAAVQVTASSNLSSTAAGIPILFSASGSGGTGALSFSWSFGDGTRGSGETLAHTFGSPGNFSVTVWANDTVGGTAKRILTVEVAPPQPRRTTGPASTSSLSLLDEITLLAASVVIAGVGLVVGLRRRKTYTGDSRVGSVPDNSLSKGTSGLSEEGADSEAEQVAHQR